MPFIATLALYLSMTLFQKPLLNRTRPRISNLTTQYDRIEIINPTAGNLIENAKADSPTFNGYADINRRLTRQINQDNSRREG